MLQPIESPTVLRSPQRMILAAIGVVCVGLALVGVFVPGLPTTVFLIVASYLFARSCPWLEERLVRGRVFRPFLPYVVGDRPMPRRARITAAALMWTAVAASLAMLASADRLGPGLASVILAAATAGTIAIARVRRPLRAPAAPRAAPGRPVRRDEPLLPAPRGDQNRRVDAAGIELQ